MRRKYIGLALAAFATIGPAQGFLGSPVFGGDREIAQAIATRLKASRDTGELKNFKLDMKVDDGVVLFRGQLAGPDQRAVVLATSEGLDGVREVVDELKILQSTAVATAKPAKLYKPQANRIAVQKDGFDFAGALASSEEAANNSVDAQASVPEALAASADVAKVPEVEAVAETATPSPTAVAEATPMQFPAQPAPEPVAIPQEVVPGIVMPTAAFESNQSMPEPVQATNSVNDDRLTQAVLGALSKAKAQGHLKDFGVDVNAYDGVIELEGTASSAKQRMLIGEIAKHAPGAVGVRNMIRVEAPAPAAIPTPAPASRIAAMPAAHRQPAPAPAMQPLSAAPRRSIPARTASYGGQYINGEQVVPGSIVNHGPVGGSVVSSGPVVSGAPVMAQPVPMAPAAPAGAPRYDSPNLPNYAWPGYAAYPNYAALSYPQQYSPSAFPYIGPFYPYPQVPIGWRKVSLEWDDGWWFLDFTDR